jgi:hypothetical protein
MKTIVKRTMIHLSVAVIAFLTGVACERAFSTYVESPRAVDYFHRQPELIGLATPLSSETFETHLPATGLPVELQRIDETYRKRCRMPTDWGGDWPTVLQLETFKTCNDGWAAARREAISEELAKYMVRY